MEGVFWDIRKLLILERETGIEPATNSLEGCDSTTELLPLGVISQSNMARAYNGCPDGGWLMPFFLTIRMISAAKAWKHNLVP